MKAHDQFPLVSVIVPNFNHASFLTERIQTILNQDFQDFELIILDDCSSDDSLRVIRDLINELPHRLVTNDYNSGSPFLQWSKGINMSTGKYIWIAESDDMASKNFLTKLVYRMETNSKISLAYTASEYINESSNAFGTTLDYLQHYFELSDFDHDFILDGKIAIENYLCKKNIIMNASSAIFRRDQYSLVGGVPTSLRFSGDWFLWVRLLQHGSLAYVSEPLNHFRVHSSKVTNTSGLDGTLEYEGFLLMRELQIRHGLSSTTTRKSEQMMIFDILSPTSLSASLLSPFERFILLLRLTMISPYALISFIKYYLTLINEWAVSLRVRLGLRTRLRSLCHSVRRLFNCI